MLGILKDHKDALVLQDDFDELDDVGVLQLTAQRHLADGGLRNARIRNLFTLLVGLELLDGKLAGLALAAKGLVDAAISSGANESDDFVSLDNPDLGLIVDVTEAAVRWVCEKCVSAVESE